MCQISCGVLLWSGPSVCVHAGAARTLVKLLQAMCNCGLSRRLILLRDTLGEASLPAMHKEVVSRHGMPLGWQERLGEEERPSPRACRKCVTSDSRVKELHACCIRGGTSKDRDSVGLHMQGQFSNITRHHIKHNTNPAIPAEYYSVSMHSNSFEQTCRAVST